MWRIQAKHKTVCPRCRGYIKIGAWIVQPEGQTRWAHVVCPKDVAVKKQQSAQPAVYEEWTPGEDGEMQVTIKENK